MIKAFKFRAKPIFSLLEATHPSGSQNSVEFEKLFSSLYIISTQKSSIHKKTGY